jgi:hypothetical protein
MIASRKVNGVTERTRPIYPYPLLARYLGQGDSKQASSFGTVRPTAITIEYNFGSCSGVHTFSNLNLDIGSPPNPITAQAGPSVSSQKSC